MNFSHPYFPKFAFLFKGGGGGAAPAVVPPPEQTPAPPLVAPAAPPATTSAPEVTNAKLDAKRQAAKRQGINSTILAAAGAGSPTNLAGQPAAGSGKNTLLGGG